MKILFVILITVMVLPLSSCMHAVMMGGHDQNENHRLASVTKEVVRGGTTVSITVPPMVVDQEENISVSLRSLTGIPERIEVHYMISQDSTENSSSGHNHDRSTEQKEFSVIHKKSSLVNGLLSIPYASSTSGNALLTIQIDPLPNSDSSLTVTSRFTVHEKMNRGMMGMGLPWKYPVLGVLVMGTMMIGMWAVRGGL